MRAVVLAASVSVLSCWKHAPPPPTTSADPGMADGSASTPKLQKEGPIAAALEQRSDGVYVVATTPSIAELVAKVKPNEACIVEPPPKQMGEPAPGPNMQNLVCPGKARS